MKRAISFAAVLAALATPAAAAETVQSLLGQDFVVVGTMTSQIGPGLFLQKKDKLFLCFASETEKSTTVATRYCKPVQ
jgi:opacity protein-like surface antigen